jgi:hypothetical protein
MAAERKTGLGPLPAGLLRPTPPPELDAPAGPGDGPDDAGEPAEGAGRGAAAEARAPRLRARRPPPPGAGIRGRKLHLPDDVHDRLWLLARQRRKSVSAVAAEILDRSLPRFKVEREG